MVNLYRMRISLQSQLSINQNIITQLHEEVVLAKRDLKDIVKCLKEEELNPDPHNFRWVENLTVEKQTCIKWLDSCQKKLKRYAKIQKDLKSILHGRVGCHNM